MRKCNMQYNRLKKHTQINTRIQYEMRFLRCFLGSAAGDSCTAIG